MLWYFNGMNGGNKLKEYSTQGNERNAVFGSLVIVYAILILSINIGMVKYIDNLGEYAIILSISSISPLPLAALTMRSSFFMKLSKIPNISGIYEGHMRSSFSQYEDEIRTRFTIVQNIFKIDIKMETKTSTSHSLSADIDKKGNDVILTYIFQNEGDITENLMKHGGVCVLSFENDKVEGEYYSSPERKRNGVIALTKITPE